MLTPRQVEAAAFDKAVFGGYDMQSVDEFLEPLTQDYITLYKENALLKSKMKVLVEKLEEYRDQEATLKSAMVAAQKTCDDMIAEAEKKCAKMFNDAESAAQQNVSQTSTQAAAEEERLRRAKQEAAAFIADVEAQVQKHLALLDALRNADLMPQAPANTSKAYNYEEEGAPDEPAPETPAQAAQSIADEIAQNMEKIVGPEDAEADEMEKTRVIKPLRTDSATAKFANLQFGKNYDPTR